MYTEITKEELRKEPHADGFVVENFKRTPERFHRAMARLNPNYNHSKPKEKAMTFFEKELIKCTEQFEGRKFVGSAMYIPLGENNRLKLQFITLGYANHYTAISLSAIDKNNGVIDKTTIEFADVWGKKQVSNPHFSDGIYPYVWKDGRNIDWYVYTPTPYDMEQLSAQIEDYALLFTEQEQTQGFAMSQTM